MSTVIVTLINDLKNKIDKEGREINGTKEVVGVVLPAIRVHELVLEAEENAIRDYYYGKGINTQAVRSLEHNLYEFIYRGLRQSVEQLLYFDKTQDFTSRRFVFSTTDCIAHVHLIYRNESASLFAHIRSTDVVKLLPWDLLFLCRLIKRVLNDSAFPHTKEMTVQVTIGSAHFYLKAAAMY